MNYVYDIYANFQNSYYDFYEWNKNDKITHIKKIPVFKIETNLIQKIIKNENKVDSSFAINIKDKTDIYNCKNKISACILTDGKNTIIIQINRNGLIIKKSAMLLDEELDILELSPRFNAKNIEIVEIRIVPVYFLTRYETERKKFILNNISKMDDKKMAYLYFECFNAKENSRKQIEAKLKNEIINNNDSVCSISYSFLKLIYANT